MHDTDAATLLLQSIASGNRSAAGDLWPLVYAELRAIAAARLTEERPDHTLQPTALVHEAYLRLIDQTRATYNDRAHFIAVASEVIRRILVDHARARRAAKRGGGTLRVPLGDEHADLAGPAADADLADLDEALEHLARVSPRQARVVELRFFGGLGVADTAAILGISDRAAELDWRFARAWLQVRLGGRHAVDDAPESKS
jgi:RNA polymerase sigma factor (TIGR02999 family)